MSIKVASTYNTTNGINGTKYNKINGQFMEK